MAASNDSPSLHFSGENLMQTPIAWFEIPTTDLERAIAFYENVFAVTLRRENCGGGEMAIFPYECPAPGGALVAMPQLQPRDNGTLVYLHGGDDLAVPLARALAAGAKLIMAKTDLGNNVGHIALFADSEGNTVGLYSPG
jgi:predicted enzyme related to lactoylglutathione lyase